MMHTRYEEPLFNLQGDALQTRMTGFIRFGGIRGRNSADQ
jgi:hypothetical protein